MGRRRVDAVRHQRVGRVEGSSGGRADAFPDLRLLQAETVPGELDVAFAMHAEEGGLFALRDGYRSLRRRAAVLIGDVIVKARGNGLSRCVVEHAVLTDARERDAGVDLEGSPGWQAHLREDPGIGGG